LEKAFRALQNHLQMIDTELDLLRATQTVTLGKSERMIQEIEQAGNVVRELEEYVSLPELCLSTENLANMVEDVVREVAREWERPGRQTRVVCCAPLAVLQLDWQQVGKALERIAMCAYAFLPAEGGEVVIEAGLRRVGPQQYLDLKVRSCGVAPLVIEEGALFRPFTRANGHQLGLSLVLVQRTVSRQYGQMFFQQISPQQSCFTLLFRT
jgi:C4-dicarboxylate-specific signal transduction histidine kinase